MHVLLANPHGIFGIYALRSVDEYNKFWAFGSGTDYALGALHCTYDRLEKVEDIARAAIEAAAEFDNATALPVTVHSVKLIKS
jgi:ATP-dependent HslUV protease subunit HslV